jgi:Tol biopolymer transport system component
MTRPRSSEIRRALSRTALIAIASTTLAGAVLAAQLGEFSTPVSAETGSDPSLNTAFNDGCPILSPDGLSLYMATNRPGGPGGLDIWVSHRATTTSGWEAPEPLPAPVNTADNEYCPTPVRGKRLFFVRAPAGTMNGDILLTREHTGGYDAPTVLGAEINSSAQEWSPSYFEDEAGNEFLYFSSTRLGPQKIFASVNFGPAQAVAELNEGGDAARPNVRKDGREIVFDSTRAPTLGGPDVWIANRESPDAPWGAPQHLEAVSSAAPDTRASLSWDGTFLLVGSARAGGEGQADIYVSSRPRLTGQ